ncbi:hypothetical protein H6P81_019505 [Aristolochia fimbriata]|uniref:Protein TIFY n=1 Tax=Aristolochia fimbriata TaxID=158543 RepID=A0AAV7DRV0_ARIFI|nr:hypothetical protein H6P81_019505 [Aristolochia fimbriata]
MGRCFNLDLRLLPATDSAGTAPAVSDEDASSPSSQELCTSRSEVITRAAAESSQQQITIFYNGRVCVCDVTEIQARAILCMAKRETEERLGTLGTHVTKCSSSSEPQPPLAPATSPCARPRPRAGLSMKKSLERFLEKRKVRIQATSSCPYNTSAAR